jgi:hypothetical protein
MSTIWQSNEVIEQFISFEWRETRTFPGDSSEIPMPSRKRPIPMRKTWHKSSHRNSSGKEIAKRQEWSNRFDFKLWKPSLKRRPVYASSKSSLLRFPRFVKEYGDDRRD